MFVALGKCRLCGRSSPYISSVLGICVDCLRQRGEEAARIVEQVHASSRIRYKLPVTTPKTRDGLGCSICGRGCLLGAGEKGYCGIRVRIGNSIRPTTGSYERALGLYYYDPHPTNCVAYSVCPAVTGRGYPRYALSPSGERGYYNIAVFYGGCNMDCLYCQNWEWRLQVMKGEPLLSIDDLVSSVNSSTTCVCFFGGDPAPWSIHALIAAEKMVARAREIGLRVFRVCWETNGLWNEHLLRRAARLSLETGGIVKIDFKAWSPEVYRALTSIEPRHVEVIRRNIRLVAELAVERREPPLLVVSTLLVPGYIDEYEIDSMTRYVAEIDPETPYIFLAFHPDYMLRDLPRTPRSLAFKAVEIARRNGLRNVYIENVWLLS